MSVSKHKQFPAQTGAYKIKVKSKPANLVGEDAVLRLEISVGQPYHEGEKFRCTLEWAKHRFGRVIILVNDSLQRFNYMFEEGLSEKEAYEKSSKEGAQWIARNMAAISTLPDFEIYRWDAWKRSQGYFDDLRKASMIYDTNAEFKAAIDEAISEIWDRRELPMERREEFFVLSKDYLLEETAAFSIIYKTFKGISAYPGSFQEMWKMFIDRDVENAPDGLKYSHCLRIDFSRRIAA